jgi:hypothetical protein
VATRLLMEGFQAAAKRADHAASDRRRQKDRTRAQTSPQHNQATSANLLR